MDLARRVSLALALCAAGLAALLALAPLAHGGGSEALSLAADGLATSVFLGSLGLAGAALSAQPLPRRLGLGPSRASRRVLALLALGCLGLSHAIDSGVEALGLRDASVLREIDAAISGARGRELLWLVLGLAVGPGFGEELLFRAFLQRGIAALAGPVAGVVCAAVLFALVHADLAHAAAAFPLGIYLGLAAWWAGSTRAAILCHLVNNAVAVIATAFGRGGGEPGDAAAPTALGGLALAGLALGVCWRAQRHAAASGAAELPPPASGPGASGAGGRGSGASEAGGRGSGASGAGGSGPGAGEPSARGPKASEPGGGPPG